MIDWIGCGTGDWGLEGPSLWGLFQVLPVPYLCSPQPPYSRWVFQGKAAGKRSSCHSKPHTSEESALLWGTSGVVPIWISKMYICTLPLDLLGATFCQMQWQCGHTHTIFLDCTLSSTLTRSVVDVILYIVVCLFEERLPGFNPAVLSPLGSLLKRRQSVPIPATCLLVGDLETALRWGLPSWRLRWLSSRSWKSTHSFTLTLQWLMNYNSFEPQVCILGLLLLS